MADIPQELKDQVLMHLMAMPISLDVIAGAVTADITSKMLEAIENDPTLQDKKDTLIEIVNSIAGNIKDFKEGLKAQATAAMSKKQTP